MRPILALLIAVVFATPGHAEDAEIASLFLEAGVEGTIVIAKLDGNRSYVHNETRAERRFPVASTFKVFSTLCKPCPTRHRPMPDCVR